MLDINEFAVRYRISPSWARQLVRAGEVRAERTDGRYRIASEEAERWLTEHSYRAWARNISRPDLSAIVLSKSEQIALSFCSCDFGAHTDQIQRRWEPHILRLRE